MVGGIEGKTEPTNAVENTRESKQMYVLPCLAPPHLPSLGLVLESVGVSEKAGVWRGGGRNLQRNHCSPAMQCFPAKLKQYFEWSKSSVAHSSSVIQVLCAI